jgi:hypothetical protein
MAGPLSFMSNQYEEGPQITSSLTPATAMSQPEGMASSERLAQIKEKVAPDEGPSISDTIKEARMKLINQATGGVDPFVAWLSAKSRGGRDKYANAADAMNQAYAQRDASEEAKNLKLLNYSIEEAKAINEEAKYKDTLKQRDAERILKAQDKTAEYVAVTDVDGKTTNIDKNSPSGKAAIEAILSRGGTVLGIGTQKPERDPLTEKKLLLEIAALENKGNELNLPEGTGESFLNALPEQLQSTVKAIAEGRLNPNQLSARNDYRNHILAAVTQYDPNFDARDVLSRFRTEVDYSVGKPSQSINAANTLLGHLTTLDSKIDNLDNKQISGYNTVANWISKNSGNPQVTSFLVARKAVVNELERVFKGTGGSLSEIRDWENAINSAGSTAQLKDAVKTAADLMESRTEALSDNYERIMGKRKQFISPKGIAALEKIKGQTVEMVDPKGTILLVPLSLVESAKKDGLTERVQ